MIFATIKKNMVWCDDPRRIGWFLSLQDVLLTTTAHIASLWFNMGNACFSEVYEWCCVMIRWIPTWHRSYLRAQQEGTTTSSTYLPHTHLSPWWGNHFKEKVVRGGILFLASPSLSVKVRWTSFVKFQILSLSITDIFLSMTVPQVESRRGVPGDRHMKRER